MIAAGPLPTPQQDLGECPVWNDRDGRLEWIDVTGKALLSSDAAGADFETQALDAFVGGFALREEGGRIIAYRRRIVLTDEAGDIVAEIAVPSRDEGLERYNDGACDSRGRYWVGTMDRSVRDRKSVV